MAISKFDEQRLQDAMQDFVNTSRNSNAFINSSNKQIELIGKIVRRISTIRYMSLAEAESYIDVKTGRFKPGQYMSYCVDEELKGLFSQLEAVTTEVNKHPWTTKEQSIIAVADKKKYLQQIVTEIRKQPGGQEVIDNIQRRIKGLKLSLNDFEAGASSPTTSGSGNAKKKVSNKMSSLDSLPSEEAPTVEIKKPNTRKKKPAQTELSPEEEAMQR